MSTVTITLTNITITADVEYAGSLPPAREPPPSGVPIPPSPPPVPAVPLPVGFDRVQGTAFVMLVMAMEAAGLTPLSVQGHGKDIVAALKARYPDLDVYLSSTDSPIWPGFGSLDVTVDSGKKGWSFRPDGYFPWKPAGQR